MSTLRHVNLLFGTGAVRRRHLGWNIDRYLYSSPMARPDPLPGRTRLRVAGTLCLLLALALAAVIALAPRELLQRGQEQLARFNRDGADSPRSLVPAVEAFYQTTRSSWPEHAARARDALTREADVLHHLLATLGSTTRSASERSALEATGTALDRLRWTYTHTRLGEAEYAVLLEQLESLVRAHALNPPAQQSWITQAGISISRSEAAMFFSLGATQARPGVAQPAVEQSSADLRHELGRVARDLLDADAFDVLEDLAEELRRSRARFPGGAWCLQGFYDGLGSLDEGRAGQFEARRARLEAWQAAKPRSLAAPIALARLMVEHAWQVRGRAAGDALSVERQAGFVHWLDQASARLHDLDPHRDPEIYRLLLEAAFANTARGAAAHADMNAMFAAAVQQYPDYFGLYALRGWQLMPQWLGERDDHLSYLQSLLRNPTPGIAQPALAFALMGTLSQPQGADLLSREALPWPEVQTAFASQERHYDPSSEALSALMLLALINGDRPMVAHTADRLGMLWEAPWFSDEAHFAATVAWANLPEPVP